MSFTLTHAILVIDARLVRSGKLIILRQIETRLDLMEERDKSIIFHQNICQQSEIYFNILIINCTALGRADKSL